MAVKVTGLKSFSKKLKSIDKKLSQRRGVHSRMVVLYEAWTKRNINANGTLHDDSRLRWQKLSFATLQIRRTRKKSPTNSTNIMRDSGQLRQRWFRNISDKEGVLTNAQDYSKYHEDGPRKIKVFGKAKATLPRRKIFPDAAQGRKIVEPAVKGFVKDVFIKT